MATTVIKASTDKREYESFVLENGLTVLLVRDVTTKKPAAALAVGVGAASDPPELPGLAHFTEHMSMQGSDLFPGDNTYKKYIADHGGASNATTNMEHTWYRFTVADQDAENQPNFKGALEIFGRFFAAPLFNPDFIAREVLAIDAEDAKNRTSDDRRLLQVLKAVTSPGCSFAKFSTGNAGTLRDAPAAREPPLEVHTAMRAFHARHYVAPNMSLAMVSPAPLAALKRAAQQAFKDVPRAQSKQNEEGAPFKKGPFDQKGFFDLLQGASGQMGRRGGEATEATEAREEKGAKQAEWVAGTPRLVSFKPLRELRRLALLWEVPVTREASGALAGQPEDLWAHLLGGEGPGSAFAALQDSGWATGLSAGPRVDQPDVAVFQVRIDLTEEGERRWRECGLVVFAYIRLLAAASDDGLLRHWAQVSAIAEMKFENDEPGSALGYANELCRRTLLFGPEHAVSAGRLFSSSSASPPPEGGRKEGPQEFDLAGARSFLGHLTSGKVVAVRTNTAFTRAECDEKDPGEKDADREEKGERKHELDTEERHELDKQEPWYGLWYGDRPLPPDLADYWAGKPRHTTDGGVANGGVVIGPPSRATLSLPEPNRYVPDDLSLLATAAERAAAAAARNALFAIKGGGGGGEGPEEQEEEQEEVEGDYGCSCGAVAAPSVPPPSAPPPLVAGEGRACAVHPGSLASPGAFASGAFRRAAAKKAERKGLAAAALELMPPPRRLDLTSTTPGGPPGGPGEGSLWWDLWYKLDATYERPKAQLTVLLASPQAHADPVHTALLCRLMSKALQQRLYAASIAGLNWSLSPAPPQGLVLSVRGFSQRAPLLLEALTKELRDLGPNLLESQGFCSKEGGQGGVAAHFETVQEQLVRNYKNWSLERADSHAAFAARLFLATGRWEVSEKLDAAQRASPASLAHFHEKLLSKVALRGLVHGNLSQADAERTAQAVHDALHAKATPAAQAPKAEAAEDARGGGRGGACLLPVSSGTESRAVSLPVGSVHRVVFAAPSKAEANSAMLLVFQAGQLETDPKKGAILRLLAQMVREPCFTTLRTRESLGYVVSAFILSFGSGKGASASSLAVSVLSKTTPPSEVEERALNFLRSWAAELRGLEPEVFEAAKRAAAAKLLEPPKRLAEEAGQWWGEVVHDDLDWTRYEDLASATLELELAEVADLYEALVVDPAKARRFAVHVHGNAHPIDAKPSTAEATAEADTAEASAAGSAVESAEGGREGADNGAVALERDAWRAWQSSMPLFPAEVERARP